MSSSCAPSPTAQQVALVNHRNELLLADLEQGTLRRLDRTDYGRNGLASINNGIAWSPDGRWLAYAFGINAAADRPSSCAGSRPARSRRSTDPVLRDMRPAFDPAGRYLYFLERAYIRSRLRQHAVRCGFPKGMRPYLLTLRRDLPVAVHPQS